MGDFIEKDRYFRVRSRLVCKKKAEDGRLAMFVLDQEKCNFVAESYYFNIFFQNSDLPYEELSETEFTEAVTQLCGFYPDVPF